MKQYVWSVFECSIAPLRQLEYSREGALSSDPDERQALLLSRRQRAVSQIDWEQRRRQCLDAVDHLYQQITGVYFANSIAQKLVTESRRQKEITEEYLGPMSSMD